MMQPEGQPSLSIIEACQVARVSRAGFYRHYHEHQPRQAETELRDAIQRIALAHRCYGYRPVTEELRKQGWMVNHKRVRRILRQDNLLSIRRRRFVLTTDSRHPYFVYPNLAADLQLTGINQLWVADITYIRLREEFLYLAVILDAYSRRVIGWELGRTLEATLAVAALRRAPGAIGTQRAGRHRAPLRPWCSVLLGRLHSEIGNPSLSDQHESQRQPLR